MILKRLLNSQLLTLAKEFKKENKEVFDIVIYGSIARNKITANDLDIAIIFLQPEKLEKKLSLSQKLKDELKKIISLEIDIRGVDIKDLFDESFLARKAILAEGFLLLNKKYLHELLGFKSYYIFSYSLKNLTPSKKVMFQYSLYGRRKEKGMVKITNSLYLGKGAIGVLSANAEEFKDLFEKNKIDYKMRKGLFY